MCLGLLVEPQHNGQQLSAVHLPPLCIFLGAWSCLDQRAWSEHGQARWGWFLFERLRYVLEVAGDSESQSMDSFADWASCGTGYDFVREHLDQLFAKPGVLEEMSVDCVAKCTAPPQPHLLSGMGRSHTKSFCAPARATVLFALALRSMHLDTMPTQGSLLQVPLEFVRKMIWAGQAAMVACAVAASSFHDLVMTAPLAWGILTSLAVSFRHVDPNVPEQIVAMNMPAARKRGKVRFALCEEFVRIKLPQGRMMSVIAADVHAPYRVARGYSGDLDGPAFLEMAVFIWNLEVLVDFAKNRRLTDNKTRTARNFDTDRFALEWGFVVKFGERNAKPVSCTMRTRLHHSSRLRCPIPRSVDWGQTFSLWLMVEVASESLSYTTGRVDICAEPRLREELLLCVDPLYRMDELERHWPGHFKMWIRYHLEPLGNKGRMLLYDLDGSVGDLVEGEERVHYVDRFEERARRCQVDCSCSWAGHFLCLQFGARGFGLVGSCRPPGSGNLHLVVANGAL
mmetsp:Transcript_93769/g.301840  ORF Transcript_93769/g.301840 Transcript_93769/m.301840 type:complete len:511 (+) Transcript_93769:340-1872(+)